MRKKEKKKEKKKEREKASKPAASSANIVNDTSGLPTARKRQVYTGTYAFVVGGQVAGSWQEFRENLRSR